MSSLLCNDKFHVIFNAIIIEKDECVHFSLSLSPPPRIVLKTT